MTAVEEIKHLLKHKIGLNTDLIDPSVFNIKLFKFLSESKLERNEDLFDEMISNQNLFINFSEQLLNFDSAFFRNIESLNIFKDYLSFTKVKNNHLKTRLLSIGCGNGEEPYSVAITLIEAGINPNNFIIDALDISPIAIESARQALFKQSSLKDTDIKMIEKYFHQAEDVFILNPKIAQLVNFHKANFIETNFFAGRNSYDFVFVQNVLADLTVESSNRLQNNIAMILSPSGVILTTDSELNYLSTEKFQKSEFSDALLMKRKKYSGIENISIPSEKKKRSKLKSLTRILSFNKNISDSEQSDNHETIDVNDSSKKMQYIKKLIVAGQLDKARETTMELLIHNNHSPDLYCLIGNIYEQNNDMEKAEDFYNQALYIEPNHYEAISKLIVLFENKGWTDKAQLLKIRLNRIIGMQ